MLSNEKRSFSSHYQMMKRVQFPSLITIGIALVIIQCCALFIYYCLSQKLLTGKDSEAVGYGYTIHSIYKHSSKNLLSADLCLLKETSTYGRDIQHLSFTARFITSHQFTIMYLVFGFPFHVCIFLSYIYVYISICWTPKR